MASLEAVYTILYGLFCVCIIVPPTEFVSAGLTVQSVFSRFIGSEDQQFIQYHIRRTAATILTHSFLPLGYYLGLHHCSPHLHLFNILHLEFGWALFLTFTIALPVTMALKVLAWSKDNWSSHSIAKTLQLYSLRYPWHSVAADINAEFLRIDKFTTAANGITRVIVTDNWIIKILPYTLNIVHQSDTSLSLVESEEHSMSHLSSTGVQILTILVSSVREGIKPFTIRLNSLEYGDLREKLQAPIRNAHNIVIHQSLSDRFVEAFKAQIQRNAKYRLPPDSGEMESCIGCMQTPSDVKLQKLCEDPDHPSDCVMCYCRPMWCVDCMGKWFASRQDQARPDTWLGSKAFCPTCRARFCLLDVCLLER